MQAILASPMPFAGFGREFMPPLNEGSLLYMPVMMPKTGLKEIQRVMSWQDTRHRRHAEVRVRGGQAGPL
jgi:Cu(I)/Ag(I) efflux system membrane protein CusA/SilA